MVLRYTVLLLWRVTLLSFCTFSAELELRQHGFLHKIISPNDIRDFREILSFHNTPVEKIKALVKSLRSTRFLVPFTVFIVEAGNVLGSCAAFDIGVADFVISPFVIALGTIVGTICAGSLSDKRWTCLTQSSATPRSHLFYDVVSQNSNQFIYNKSLLLVAAVGVSLGVVGVPLRSATIFGAGGFIASKTKYAMSHPKERIFIVTAVGGILCGEWLTQWSTIVLLQTFFLRCVADRIRQLRNDLKAAKQCEERLQKQLDIQLELVANLLESIPGRRESNNMESDPVMSDPQALAKIEEIATKKEKKQCLHPACQKMLGSRLVYRGCGCRSKCKGHKVKYKEETLSHYCWEHRHYPATELGPSWSQLDFLKRKVDTFKEVAKESERFKNLPTFYHGTSLVAALSIQQNGFNVNLSGTNAGMMLGPGVYVTSTLTKALNYANPKRHGGAVLVLKVDLGKVYKISASDSKMKTWHSHGFDSAFSAAGLNGKREEHCVWDPKRVHISNVVLGHTAQANKHGYFVVDGKLSVNASSAEENCIIM